MIIVTATLASCSAWDWLKCATVVAQCVSTCEANGISSQQCISCFGNLYDKCIGCISLQTALQSVGLLQGTGHVGVRVKKRVVRQGRFMHGVSKHPSWNGLQLAS